MELRETPTVPRDPIPLTTPLSTVTDADTTSPRLTNITVTLRGALDISEQINFQGTVFPSTISRTRLSFTEIALLALASPSAADFLQILNSIRYSNDEQEPTPGVRTVEFRISDDLFTSLSITYVDVIEINDVPTLYLNSSRIPGPIEASYTQGALPVLFIFGASISDPDSSIVAAVITIQVFDDGDEIISVSQREAESAGINSTTMTRRESTGLFITLPLLSTTMLYI